MVVLRTNWRPDLDSACPKSPILTIFLTKSVTWNIAKKLPTLGTLYKAIPDQELTLPEGLLPDPARGIDTSLRLTQRFHNEKCAPCCSLRPCDMWPAESNICVIIACIMNLFVGFYPGTLPLTNSAAIYSTCQT